MKLFEILKEIDYRVENGQDNIEINKIEYDSRKIEKGDLFVCIEGYATDGHKYAKQAIQKGAIAVICQKHIEVEEGVIIKVKNSREALSKAAANYYGRPADKLKLIGITGTNGKTTSAFMAKYILEQAGFKVGLIGTIANYIGNKKIHTERTTPESLELQGLFKEMVDEGIDYCVMEVSSHSLFLDRVSGVKFSQAIFTNLTRDHLDFHITFENYYNSKLILFKNTLNSIVNIDDSYGLKLLEDSEGEKTTVAIEKHADITAENIHMNSTGATFTVHYKLEKENITLNLPGKYNVMNALGVIAACVNEHIALKVIREGLENMLCVPGRCEIVTIGYNLGYEVIVDYAHTPDGLENILKTAREFTRGRLISVFGCGGDRDKTKRPIMGKIGAELSDIAIITSDNPRGEEPMGIIEDVVKGIEGLNYIVEESRRAAIKKAMSLAKENDVIVVAGKGHEDYQILKNETIHFDEREVIKEIIEELKQ